MILMIGILGYEKWYMSRLMDTKKMLMLRRHFLSHLIVLFFAISFQITNQPCGEKFSLIMGLSNHCAICFCFVSSWRDIMFHVLLLSSFVFITREINPTAVSWFQFGQIIRRFFSYHSFFSLRRSCSCYYGSFYIGRCREMVYFCRRGGPSIVCWC